jgi:hypothetical protein
MTGHGVNLCLWCDVPIIAQVPTRFPLGALRHINVAAS